MTSSTPSKKSKWKKSLLEWGVLISVILLLYLTGLHTQVIGTFQRGVLSTGMITPPIPESIDDAPAANMEFYFVDKNSSMKSLADFEGDVIFMNIWATWCPPCIAEMPSIQSLYDELQDLPNVSFLLVSVDENFEIAEEFMANRNFTLPTYHFRNKAPGTYSSTVIPTTYVISPEGKLVMEKRGLAKYDTDAFIDFMKKLSERPSDKVDS